MITIEIHKRGCTITGNTDELQTLGMMLSTQGDMLESGNTPSPSRIWDGDNFFEVKAQDSLTTEV